MKCDVWSCGVILYVLLSGKQPFSGRNEHEVFQKIRQGNYKLSAPRWRAVSRSAKDLLSCMLLYNPSQRFTALEALNHPWIQAGNKTDVDSEETKLLVSDLSTFQAQS